MISEVLMILGFLVAASAVGACVGAALYTCLGGGSK